MIEGEALVWIKRSLIKVSICWICLVRIYVRILRGIYIWLSLGKLLSHLVKVRIVVVVRVEWLVHWNLLVLILILLIRVILLRSIHWIHWNRNLVLNRWDLLSICLWLIVLILRYLISILRRKLTRHWLLEIIVILLVSEGERILIVLRRQIVVRRRNLALSLLYLCSQFLVFQLLNQ